MDPSWGPSSWCSRASRGPRSAQPGTTGGRSRPPPSARSAFMITRTSIASWSSAPATGSRSPAAAAPIATIDSPIPMPMLWTAIRRERRAIRMASGSRSRRSTAITRSAASELAVAPRAPIATPTSAVASAGASFSPSPTITRIPAALSRSSATASTLSAGVRSARTASTPIAAPTMSATPAWSPVTITIRRTPARRRERMTRGVSGRIGSSRTSAPASRPSAATQTAVAPSIVARRRTSRAQAGSMAIDVSWTANATVPTRTSIPSTTPETPAPGVSTASSGSDRDDVARPRAGRRSTPRARAGRAARPSRRAAARRPGSYPVRRRRPRAAAGRR